MIRAYYELTKPRLALMNVLVAAAVYIFASPDLFNWENFAIMSSGLLFVIASASTFNNYIDRSLDAKMERTKKRGLVTGEISPIAALAFASILLIGGVLLLQLVNLLALGSALLGFIVYVFMYTPLKRKTGLALYVGAVAGATPTLVGYAAATYTLDLIAFGLFAVLFLWQVPHFLAIARYRYSEYTAGGVPLLVREPKNKGERDRARKIFHYSLVVLAALCVLLILHRWIR